MNFSCLYYKIIDKEHVDRNCDNHQTAADGITCLSLGPQSPADFSWTAQLSRTKYGARHWANWGRARRTSFAWSLEIMWENSNRLPIIHEKSKCIPGNRPLGGHLRQLEFTTGRAGKEIDRYRKHKSVIRNIEHPWAPRNRAINPLKIQKSK